MLASHSHLFICFSSKDEATARAVVEFLEANGLKCWISSRDVPAGHNYQEVIVEALEAARGIVFLFSEFSNKSGEIKKELSIGGSINTPVFPLRLAPITPGGALRYELATRQWIDLFPDREQALQRLLGAIRRVLEHPAAAVDLPSTAPPASASSASAAGPGPAAAPVAKADRQPSVVAPDGPEFEAVRALLARHVGPIAKVLVQKAATEAGSLDELCERLATHVRAPEDRAAFLQAARARLKA